MSRLTARAVELGILALAAVLLLSVAAPATADGGAQPLPAASGWTTYKDPTPQGPLATCAQAGWPAQYYDRLDCGFGVVAVSETTAASTVAVSFAGPDGTVFLTQDAVRRSDGRWGFDLTPAASWPAGKVEVRASVDGKPAVGGSSFFHNTLSASLATTGGPFAPGDEIDVTGTVVERDTTGPGTDTNRAVPAQLYLQTVRPDGTVIWRGAEPITADSDGTFAAKLPSAATQGVTATADTGYATTVAVEAVDASYTDPLTGAWRAPTAGSTSVELSVPPTGLLVDNSFVSAVGWVKPGSQYTFRVIVRNYTDAAGQGVSVTVPAADGMSFRKAETSSGSATVTPTQVTWSAGTVAARTDAGPGLATLVVEAEADTLAEDPRVVWKNLSTTATLSYTGGPGGLTSTSQGPKVIPPSKVYDTARYGHRPFPVVPVDYFDRKHAPEHSGARLSTVINSPTYEGSTFNLFQEMSYGQLFPNGTVPSAAIARAGWDAGFSGRHAGEDFDFTDLQPQGTCYGLMLDSQKDTPSYPDRIQGGWYQLPGTTGYYGGDRVGPLAAPGVPIAGDIDGACGPTAKAVYDAAHIADPEIDYSDYDTDKDGVVDFFMMIFAGEGGHGASQTSVPPYDNIWPHSSSLEFTYKDAATALKGYISDDQLKDEQGRPLFYTDDSYSAMTLENTGKPVWVRVGPYNVNPESAMDHASVISHEYGHSLGLPDYYSTSTSGRETYGDWNLMATDKSQHMDVNAKQELGWLVPRVLEPGTTTVTGWQDSKRNTHRIDWVEPDGTSYTLEGPSVNNGEAYVAKLPGRQILDPAKVERAKKQLWWSQSGNDFGCAPLAGHNLDVDLSALQGIPAGTPVTLTFKSLWDIEWDYDYGFVMVSTDGGQTFQSLPSKRGYTTEAAFNPSTSSCQGQYGNGITGTSGSYAAGTATADRLAGLYPDPVFLDDEYDLGAFAGQEVVLRFSYATDPGLARPGWFIDDVKVDAGGNVLYASDFESGDDEPQLWNGGCKGGLQIVAACTDGWQHIDASQASEADHAYYLEMRDRSGFDLEGHGQIDRDPIGWSPGLLLVYTNEAHGYGNFGTPDPPAQSPLDSNPDPGNGTPDLNDAAFTAAAGKSSFSDSISAARPGGWVDNYSDPNSTYGDSLWHFDYGCLTFDVLRMEGEDLGPATAPGNLAGDVRFTIGEGCGAFNYGYLAAVPAANEAPTAVAQAKPQTAKVGQKVRFDGSASTDDAGAGALTYRWDVDGDGDVDLTGPSVDHAYAAAGTYDAVLRVTDAGGLFDTDTVRVVVEPAPGNGGGGGPGGGGGGSGGGGGGGGSSGGGSTTTTPAPTPSQPAAGGAPAQAGGVLGEAKAKRLFVRGSGRLSRTATLRVDLRRGLGKVTYADRARKLTFRSLGKPKVTVAGKRATLRGTGRQNGRTVTFVATVADRGARRDRFTLRTSGGLRVSGTLAAGNLVVR